MPGRFFYPTGRWRHTGSALSLKDARKSHDIIPDNERLVYYLANILQSPDQCDLSGECFYFSFSSAILQVVKFCLICAIVNCDWHSDFIFMFLFSSFIWQ